MAGLERAGVGSHVEDGLIAGGAASLGEEGSEVGRDYEEEGIEWLGRWRDLVDAGLHVAATTDMPWFLTDFKLTDDIGRPQDQVAGGMDGRGRVYPEAPEWVLDQLLSAEEGPPRRRHLR